MKKFIAVPYIVWLGLFVVAPLIMVVVYAFSTSGGAFTLNNFQQATGYANVFARSLWLALLATAICLLVGYPLAYALSREGPRFQKMVMMLIMLPMWMNFLLRTYAWMSLLENTGLINGIITSLGLPPLRMINTQGAVV
ncbi:MAG: ABC transporter permease, partial [Oscillospiraceae bacterium]|nr:ABC transporter permease [Oscillospiraceae bacterium]